MRAKFGPQSGYGWRLNETVGAQMIYVPASDPINSARTSLFLFLAIFSVVFALSIALINVAVDVPRCAQIPVNALEQVGTTGAVVTAQARALV